MLSNFKLLAGFPNIRSQPDQKPFQIIKCPSLLNRTLLARENDDLIALEVSSVTVVVTELTSSAIRSSFSLVLSLISRSIPRKRYLYLLSLTFLLAANLKPCILFIHGGP